MSKTEASKILKQFNDWRRCHEDPNNYQMPDPTELGIALEVAVEVLNSLTTLDKK